MTSIFDGIDNPDKRPTMLRLEDVRRFDSDTIWLRYKIKNKSRFLPYFDLIYSLL